MVKKIKNQFDGLISFLSDPSIHRLNAFSSQF